MFAFGRTWRDLIERQVDFCTRQWEAAMERVDGLADDRKEFHATLREVREQHRETNDDLRRKVAALERHIANVYGWNQVLATRYGLEQPPAPPDEPGLSDEEIERRTGIIENILDTPYRDVPMNFDDILEGFDVTEQHEPPEQENDERDAEERPENATAS